MRKKRRIVKEDTALTNNPNPLASPFNNNNPNQGMKEMLDQNKDKSEQKVYPNSMTEDEIKKMSPEEIINITYFNIPANLDDKTRELIYKRADEIRKERSTNNEFKVNPTLTAAQANNVVQEALQILKKTGSKNYKKLKKYY